MYLYRVEAYIETDKSIVPYKKVEVYSVAESNTDAIEAGLRYLESRGYKPMRREDCVLDGHLAYEYTPKAKFVTDAVSIVL